MTIRQEAYQLIDHMPEKSVRFIVELIHNMSIEFREKDGSVQDADEIKKENICKLNVIRELPDNWNENGAKAFSRDLTDTVENILCELEVQPEIFPTACDSIQLEFDNSNGDHMEIEITQDENAEIFLIDKEGKEQFEWIRSEPKIINQRVKKFYE